MVRLKNITRDGRRIEADFSPERSDIWGHLSFELCGKGKFDELDNVEYSISEESQCGSRVAHRVIALKRLANNDVMPKEHTVTWY